MSVISSYRANPLIAKYCILPSNWDDAWKAAKANARNQYASVVGIGDSITAGQGATDIMVDAWWPKLRSSILAANGNLQGGDHYSALYTSAFGVFTATPPVTIDHQSGTTNFNAAWMTTIYNGSGTPFMHCTPPYNVVGFDILYMDYSAGTWTYNIDGGANTTVTTTGPGTAAGSTVKKISITGLSAGTHTLNINGSGTANVCNIAGITAYAASSGICFANMGWPGMGLYTGTTTHNALADTGQFPPDRLALYQGYTGTTAAPTALKGLGFPAQPDLALIAFGINDATQGSSKANFRDTLDRLVYSLRYGKNDACSVVIVPMYMNDGNLAAATVVANSDYTASATTAYRDLRDAMQEVAINEGCAFVDVHNLFGRAPFTNGWSTSVSDVHPTPAGHAKIANLLASIL